MFLAYTLLLMLSGVALIALGVAFRDQGTGSRVLSIVVGLAFFAYGFYLAFLFEGGSYRIFFYAFVVPVLLIVRAVKARTEARDRAAQPAYPAPQGQPGYPAPQGQPGYPAPQGQPGYPAP